MRTVQQLSLLFVLLALSTSCVQPPDYPIEPVIEYLGVSKNILRQGQGLEDTVFVTIGFTDGDGDIGNFSQGSGQVTLDLFFTDKRTGTTSETFSMPFVPELGVTNGISGEITARLFTTCCIFPPWVSDAAAPCQPSQQYPMDTLIYEIYIKDRAGNESNRIETEPLLLRCL
jgi:hypothetical protein